MKQRYNLVLKRSGVICRETFIGTKLELLIYKFKMRKWEISIEN
jgi:hypothetical protein